MTKIPHPTRTSLLIEIRAGEGGDDAAQFGEELANALATFARNNGVSVAAQSSRTTVLYLGEGGEELGLERFSGTHRIQRIPKNDRGGRRHTSTATVAVMTPREERGVDLLDDELRVDFYRGHGKGGQHRNKTSSAVRLTHLPSGMIVVVERGRSQAQNLESARAELRRRLEELRGSASATAQNQSRAGQIRTGERPMKQWTWNTQRGEVLNHTSGEKYRMNAFLRGDLDG